MSENNSKEARGNEMIELKAESHETFENGADDVSERAPLLPDIQTLKITSPNVNRSKKSNVFDKLLPNSEADTSNADSTSEVSASTDKTVLPHDTCAPGPSGTERQRSYTEPSRPLKWRLIGPYQDLRISKCRRLYAKSGRKDDLALFFQNGRFYAMEAWCSHMGKRFFYYSSYININL